MTKTSTHRLLMELSQFLILIEIQNLVIKAESTQLELHSIRISTLTSLFSLAEFNT